MSIFSTLYYNISICSLQCLFSEIIRILYIPSWTTAGYQQNVRACREIARPDDKLRAFAALFQLCVRDDLQLSAIKLLDDFVKTGWANIFCCLRKNNFSTEYSFFNSLRTSITVG